MFKSEEQGVEKYFIARHCTHEMLPWADGLGKYVLFRCVCGDHEEHRSPSVEHYRQFRHMARYGTMKGYVKGREQHD